MQYSQLVSKKFSFKYAEAMLKMKEAPNAKKTEQRPTQHKSKQKFISFELNTFNKHDDTQGSKAHLYSVVASV